ncbi:hypothetical protein [Paenibacillus antarcticus]|uniref:RCK N-terminal domain-containing protein n=1 Tax=Paenibacillus antarcticus TaxID=253703 RepID=A0A168NDG1_9BACL|nr:hypothetical protein [Paenibacillus antarcticus]OAB45676.1 hypothetical protein PBAT_12235 [Paenibacillus antarcticus]
MEDAIILVIAPNEDGRKFVDQLMYRKKSFAILTNNRAEEKMYQKMGVKNVVRIDTFMTKKWIVPQIAVDKIYIFESSLNLSCRYLQICRPWTSQEIYIVTRFWSPRGIYRGMGADHVVYTKNGDVEFLLER